MNATEKADKVRELGLWVCSQVNPKGEDGYQLFSTKVNRSVAPFRKTAAEAQADYEDAITHTHSRTTCAADVEGPSVWWLCGHAPTWTERV